MPMPFVLTAFTRAQCSSYTLRVNSKLCRGATTRSTKLGSRDWRSRGYPQINTNKGPMSTSIMIMVSAKHVDVRTDRLLPFTTCGVLLYSRCNAPARTRSYITTFPCDFHGVAVNAILTLHVPVPWYNTCFCQCCWWCGMCFCQCSFNTRIYVLRCWRSYAGWCSRIKHDFTFEYIYLEDELQE